MSSFNYSHVVMSRDFKLNKYTFYSSTLPNRDVRVTGRESDKKKILTTDLDPSEGSFLTLNEGP